MVFQEVPPCTDVSPRSLYTLYCLSLLPRAYIISREKVGGWEFCVKKVGIIIFKRRARSRNNTLSLNLDTQDTRCTADTCEDSPFPPIAQVSSFPPMHCIVFGNKDLMCGDGCLLKLPFFIVKSRLSYW